MDQDPAREHRIDHEIVVDAYDESEVAMGWYAYLENHLSFPFEADYLPNSGVERARVTITELEEYEEFEGDDEDEYEGDYEGEARELEFSVTMRWDGDEFSAALEHIFPVDAGPKTLEAILDWHYWKARRG